MVKVRQVIFHENALYSSGILDVGVKQLFVGIRSYGIDIAVLVFNEESLGRLIKDDLIRYCSGGFRFYSAYCSQDKALDDIFMSSGLEDNPQALAVVDANLDGIKWANANSVRPILFHRSKEDILLPGELGNKNAVQVIFNFKDVLYELIDDLNEVQKILAGFEFKRGLLV